MDIAAHPSRITGRRGKVCLALGFFDGVHLGHQQIIRQTVADARASDARSVVVTFDRHANTVVAPERVPPLIYPLSQKLRAIASLGPDALLLLRFNLALSRLPGEEFVRRLVRDFGAVNSLCVGENFAFGHKRSGNVALLRRLGKALGFSVHGLASVALDGQPVSSTRIRKAVQAGDLHGASQMLGRAYSVASRVIRGDRLGRKIGFPTANLDITGLGLPPNGVYVAIASVPGRPAGARQWKAVVNIGVRPTLNRPHPPLRLEAHLLGFDGDLRSRDLEITFVRKLRDEIRFSSLTALKDQIGRDVREATLGANRAKPPR